MADKWYNDSEVTRRFQEVLIDADVLSDPQEIKSFLSKPMRYDDEYDAWANNGFPSVDDENWDDFIDAISDDEEEGEESDDS